MRSRLPVGRIARLAGVSPATVSRAINHQELVQAETLQKIMVAMEELGLKPSPAMILDKNIHEKKIIALNMVRDSNPFYSEILRGIESSAKNHGYEVIHTASLLRKQDISDYIHLMERIRISGLITLNRIGTEELDVLNAHFPVIQCSEYNDDSAVPYVSIDDKAAVKQAVNFLISAGRNKIALLNGPISTRYARQRQEGFLEAMEAAALHVPKSWLIHVPGIDYDMAYTSASQLMKSDSRPNAILGVSDVLALAAMNAAWRYRLRIPGDVMVVGFDNIPLCRMVRPAITSVAQPTFQLGFAACENLIADIDHPGSVASATILATELIIRGSARMM